jgi:hypothetical protein
MSRKFPHAQIVGLDIAPVPLSVEQIPPNVRFEVDDINFGLPQFTGSSEGDQVCINALSNLIY